MSYKNLEPGAVLRKLHTFAQYRKETGTFIRTQSRSGPTAKQIIGEPIGTPMNEYLTVSIFGTNIRLHNLVWLEEYGCWPEGELDHIDGNGKNNRVSNLRDVSHKVNGQNRKQNGNNTTGYTGVSFNKSSCKYQAYVRVNYKLKTLGSFNTAQDAAFARATYITNNPKLSFTQRHGI